MPSHHYGLTYGTGGTFGTADDQVVVKVNLIFNPASPKDLTIEVLTEDESLAISCKIPHSDLRTALAQPVMPTDSDQPQLWLTTEAGAELLVIESAGPESELRINPETIYTFLDLCDRLMGPQLG